MGKKIHSSQVSDLPEVMRDVSAVADFAIENRNLINSLKTIKDDTDPTKKFRLGVENGLLYIEEVIE